MPAPNIENRIKHRVLKITLILLFISLIIGINLWRNYIYQGPLVHTTKVEEKNMGEKVYASGSIVLQEKQEEVARDNRVLRQTFVKTGDQVKAGQLLAILECVTEERMLADARANLAMEELEYKNNLRPSDEDLAIGKAEFKEAKTAYDNKQKDWQRKEALYNAGAISTQEMEKARQELMVQEIMFLKARKSYDILCNGPRTAERKVAEAKLERARAIVHAAEQDLARYIIKADMDGIILNLEGQPGDLIKAGERFLTLGHPACLQIRVGVSEADAARVKPGQNVNITAAALPENIFKGEVIEVAGLARIKEGNSNLQVEVPVRISVEDDSSHLKPGYSVDLEIITVIEKQRLVIPYEALLEDNGRKQVWVFDNGTARLQNITTGLEGELYLEVLQGLNNGDLLIIDPPDNLRDSQKVRQSTAPAVTPEDDLYD
ncbi:MAG: efflux RND transporter periplasmic adaptor subunit [Syntrophomonadaceae bacterium]|nr:efflux RND transporter periplasmic adaptor subunit [Syntrophomonadaceae bacterium]